MLRVPPFIGTLAMGLFILVGFQQKIAPDGTVSLGLPENFGSLGQGETFGIRNTVIIAALVLLFAHLLLKHTVLGRHMYAVGGGLEAARLAGIRVDVVRIVAFTLCGLACGLGGFLTASTFGLGSAQAGGSILLDAFTACFIGASTLTIGRFHILGTTLGVLTLGMLTNGLTLTGWTSDDVPIAKGVILIVAVAAAGLLATQASVRPSPPANPPPGQSWGRCEASGSARAFPGVRALEDVSIRFSPGTVHALVGENGAGKSTLIKILAGAQTARHRPHRDRRRAAPARDTGRQRQARVGLHPSGAEIWSRTSPRPRTSSSAAVRHSWGAFVVNRAGDAAPLR